MKFLLKPTDPSKLEVDVLGIFTWQNQLGQAISTFPQELQTHIKEAATKETFIGKSGQFLTVSGRGGSGPYKVLVTGVGEEKSFDVSSLQEAVAKSVGKMQSDTKPAKIAFVMPLSWMQQFDAKTAVAATVEAVRMATYRFLHYKSAEEKKQTRDIEEVILAVPPGKIQQAEEGITQGNLFASGTLFARDLVNEPSYVATPSHLASTAQSIAKSSGGKTKVTLYGKDEIEKMGMNAYLGVARGSDEPPVFIRLEYKPSATRSTKKIVLVGKGITFDTGGLSLKPAEHMETMKLDMAGAAAVLGVFHVLSALAPHVHVVGLIAACENMPSGRAMKPGDIVKAYNGKTIEVLNTDAEGRLTLADMLSFATAKEKPDVLIDLATLTGACMVALGYTVAGLWSNNPKLSDEVRKAASRSGEKVWEMPLEHGYLELIKSHIADIKNIQSGKYGGAVTAALFLEEFVDKKPWVHIDMAGPAFVEKDTPLAPFGGTGFGVRLLLQYLVSH